MEYVMTRSEPTEGRAYFRGDDKVLHPLPLRTDRVNHSPDGHEWGYGGSGPAQLAHDMIAHATGNDALAGRVYQKFKAAVVAKKLVDHWVIDRFTVRTMAFAFDKVEIERGARKRVLIADDLLVLAELHARLFDDAGWSAFTARDGEEALDIQAQRGPFDLFVLDYEMPRTSGLEVATSLRRAGVQVPIVIYSGRDVKTEANAAGALFFRKGGDPEDLVRMACDIVEEVTRVGC